MTGRHSAGSPAYPILMCSTVRRVLAYVQRRTGVDSGEILGRSRLRDHVRARWRVMRILRRMHYSLPQIGMAMNRDHTTVLYALRGGRAAR